MVFVYGIEMIFHDQTLLEPISKSYSMKIIAEPYLRHFGICNTRVHDVSTRADTEDDEAEHNPIADFCLLHPRILDPWLDIAASELICLPILTVAMGYSLSA